MTIRSIRRPFAAAVLVCAFGVTHAAKDGPGGHDPSQDELLLGMAVHAVAAHDRLKSQITTGTSTWVPPPATPRTACT